MPSLLEIRLFGPQSVRIGGEPIPRLKTRKGLWLLALLALRQDRDVDRNWLAGTLWPDTDEATSLTYLRQALTDLRKALGPASVHLESLGFRSLRLNLSDADCDVVRFDALVMQGTPDAYEEAVALYSGPLLEGCTEEWVFQERESRTQTWLRALEALANHEIESGNAAPAVRRLRQVIAAEPLRESAYRELMRALDAVGDATAALETYRDLRQLVRREMNVEPDPETRALFESIRSDVRNRAHATSAPGGALPVKPQGMPKPPQSEADEVLIDKSIGLQSDPPASKLRLPHFVSEFIGREREIVAVKRCLAASRLVTLTGVGGVGKTRLAVRIADEEAGRFSDGVTFVDFAPLSEPSLAAGSVATVLGLRERPSRPASETVADFLESRSMMLVLDNCEHILGACAGLASDLLKRCRDLRILATSRQRLRISGETEWRVPPLETPPESIPTNPDQAELLLRGNEAMSLFMDRAMRARPTLGADMDTLHHAADICRRLDGIPLALELAAARLQALTVAQLAERVKERFSLLVVGDSTAPVRQKTLRAMLDWSHDLLSSNEQILFRRLSVFAGGWTLEAAEAACPGYPDGEFSLLDGLTSLVDKSLVLFSETGGKGRYGILETVRQYALEKLARSGEEIELRGLQRDHFVNFAEEAALHLMGPAQAEWLDSLEVEHDNLRAALDWCVEGPDGISAGLRLAGALNRFWFHRAHFAEGRKRYSELLRLDVQAQPTPERALALQGAGNMEYRLGNYPAASELFEQALTIRRQGDDRTKEGEVLTNLGNSAYLQGQYERALPIYSEGLKLHRSAGNIAGAVVALHGLANLAFRTGDVERAQGLFEQCLAECRACGNRTMEATVQVSLGLLQEEQGKAELAKEGFEQALSIFRELRDVSQEMVCLNNLGDSTRLLGEIALSRRCYRDGLLVARMHPGNREERVVAYLLEGVAMLAFDTGDARGATWLLAAAVAVRQSIAARRPPQDQQEFDRDLAKVRAALDPQSFEDAWSEGGTARVETAISKALEMVA